MTRTFLFTAAAIAAFGSATLAPTQAVAKIETLEECYNAVITWCNETYPEMDCSNASGLDDCDEEFGNHAGGGTINKLKALGQGRPARAELRLGTVDERPARSGRN